MHPDQVPLHNIQFNATYTCRIGMTAGDPPTSSCVIASSRNLTGGEHTVRATRWVIVNYTQVSDTCSTL